MSIYKEMACDNVVSTVSGIQFCVMSPTEILRRSAVEVTENQAFAGNEPVPNGLFDTRMGVIDNHSICSTCHQTNLHCPGHFGHVVLAKPVFYIQFFEFVRKLMRCVCFRCSKILVNIEAPDVAALLGRKSLSRMRRWEAMFKLCQKAKRCGHDTMDGCGARVPDRVSKTEDMKMRIRMLWKESAPGAGDGREVLLTAEDVLRVLQRITDAHSEALGFSAKFNRPEWMVCTVLPVPPPSVRPSVRQENGQRSEDDLTHKLSDIIKMNNQIKHKQERAGEGATMDTIDATGSMQYSLQYHVATFIDNSCTSMYPCKDRAGRALRSLLERLRHKDGRIRGNLMGKRVDHSARTVITPDPNLSIDELGVPLKIAMDQTFPEVVGPLNRDELQALVIAGPDVYPGAKHVRVAVHNNDLNDRNDRDRHGGEANPKRATRTIMLRNHPDRAGIVLQDGDVVERHLRNGDYVLFNRQPSLHKISMMGHRVRVMPYDTFRLNVCVCKSYNADFDGDEMNMHVPQSLQTHYEIKQLAAVPLHIISPRYSAAIIGPVQDVALGVYRMSMPEVTITHRQMMNLLVGNDMTPWASEFEMSPSAAPLWSGRRVLSTVLPPTANLSLQTAETDAPGYDPQVHEVRIEHGRILSGVLSQKVFMAASTGLVQATYNTLGPNAVVSMLNATQKLICDWLVISGFSVGIGDLSIPDAVVIEQRKILDAAKGDVRDVIRSVHDGTFKNNSTKSNTDYIEELISSKLSAGSGAAGKLSIKHRSRDNRMLDMINSGSKGKDINYLQMTSCLGPQAIESKRVPDGFGHRTLPHFTKFDDGPEARGFVEHSFIQGLEPHEFFFHSMAGRIGLINTAVLSVTRETEVVIAVAGKGARQVRIGDWIDELLARDGDAVEHFPDQANLELLTLGDDQEVYIPTGDAHGNASWGRLTAVTRHDPSERLYRVMTVGGREVTVAESKSLLVWKPETETFEMTHSPDVRPGDFLPVAANLPEAPPSVVRDHVMMSDFLSRSDHIFGTDFNKAVRCWKDGAATDYTDYSNDGDTDSDAVTGRRMSDEAQGEKFHIPRGWWEKHNGPNGSFHLPYSKKSLLTRACSGRSNVDNVQDGLVYPYHATRCHGGVPECFLLDYDNGVFIGMFLADGHTCEKSGTVGITKNEPAVREWVQGWFERHGFTTGLTKSTNDMGFSLTINGRSTLLARFLDRWVGHGSRNKHVPDVAFTAPIDFVRGLLSGYFGGDGSVGENYIESSSASRDLNEGIAMLCSRLGAFAKLSVLEVDNILRPKIVPMYRLSLRAQWAGAIAREIMQNGGMVHPEKAAKLLAMVTKTSTKYVQKQDMVLDPIKTIEVLGADAHPKLYDVTVPSTLNFTLRNGLNVVDTSETGYIQRRLVKAMEDCKTQHDLTVRNASNYIVQFLYGEDGMDSIKLEHQYLPYIDMEVLQMYDMYYYAAFQDKGADKGADKGKGVQSLCDAHFRQLLDDRSGVIMSLHEGMEMHDIPIVYPVHIQRLVDAAAASAAASATSAASSASSAAASSETNDALVAYMLGEIDRLSRELRVPTALPRLAQPAGLGGRAADVYWMPVLLRCFLSPKALIARGVTRATFDDVCSQIERLFWDAIATPGEMVGIIAAQSIGEISTQLTLDTFHTSGVAAFTKVTSGIPRMKELMSMSKRIKTPTMNIRLRPEWAASLQQSSLVLSEIRTTYMRDVVTQSSIYFDPHDDENTHVAADRGLLKFYTEYGSVPTTCSASASPWLLRLVFDRMKMLELNVTMLDIEMTLSMFYDNSVACIVSDDNAADLVCRLRIAALPTETDDLLTEIKALEHSLMDGLVIKGVPGISKAMVEKPKGLKRFDAVSEAFVADDQWSIMTSGSNLIEVMCHPSVDETQTTTNDVYEVYLTLGVEAARQVLITEMRGILADQALDFRHISLLVDTMSSRGAFMSIDRHGINNRGDLGPLAKCSFEQTTDMLIKAGVFAERDPITGVSANTMLGQVAPCGTGNCTVLLDGEALAAMGRPAAPLGSRTERQPDSARDATGEAIPSDDIAGIVDGIMDGNLEDLGSDGDFDEFDV